MPKTDKALNKFAAINKTFLQNKDIAVLMDCSETKASYYRRMFLKQYEEEKDYFAQLVPTTEFIEFYNIDMNRIRDNYIVVHQILREEKEYAKL